MGPRFSEGEDKPGQLRINQTNFLKPINVIWVVQSSREKYFA
jgi:hypothetical protein